MRLQMHPLDPLEPDEISQAAKIIHKATKDTDIIFRVVALQEPPKEELISCLDNCPSDPSPTSRPPRLALVQTYQNQALHEYIADLNKNEIVAHEVLHGRHSYIDPDYMRQVEAACIADSRIQQEIEALELPDGATVVAEPWAYATDGLNDMKERITMCWLYMRLSQHPDANYYAYPLDIGAEVSGSLKVTKIYHLPSSANGEASKEKVFDHRKIQSSSEYHPDLEQERRKSTHPYHISQPDGPSFQISGNLLTWENGLSA